MYINKQYPDQEIKIKNKKLIENIHVKLSAENSFFANGCNFSRLTVLEETSFKDSIFQGNSVFNWFYANKTITFEKVLFLGKSSFKNSIFYNKVYFTKTVFTKYTKFNKAQFKNSTVFYGTDFREKIQFWGAYSKHIKFDGANINKEVDFEGSEFIKFDFKPMYCNSLKLNGCYIEKHFNMYNSVKKIYIDKMFIKGLIIQGKISLDWNSDEYIKMIYNQNNESTYKSKAEQFLVLKEQFSNQGRYDNEDAAYVEFKRCERKDKYPFEEVITKLKEVKRLDALRRVCIIIQNIKVCLQNYKTSWKWVFEYWVFDKIGSYGTNKPRTLFSVSNVI